MGNRSRDGEGTDPDTRGPRPVPGHQDNDAGRLHPARRGPGVQGERQISAGDADQGSLLDGSKPIVFRISFSDNFEMDFRTLRDHALEATNGEVRRAKRVNKDSNLSWEIRVKPDGTDDVVITLPATEDCADDGALCTSDGRMLYNTVSVTIPGP